MTQTIRTAYHEPERGAHTGEDEDEDRLMGNHCSAGCLGLWQCFVLQENMIVLERIHFL